MPRFGSSVCGVKSSMVLAFGLLLGSAAHAQFGGFLQSVIGAAAQQAAQQAIQPAPAPVNPYAQGAAGVAPLTAAQANAVASAAAAIPITDPEYQALVAQSLATIPADQRSTMAPIIDMQVRQNIASRRLGYAGAPLTAAGAQVPQGVVPPVAHQAVQGALMQGLAGQQPGYAAGLPAHLGSNAGKAVAAGALIQGLGSFFSRPAASPAPEVAPAAAVPGQAAAVTAP